jgi:hypothetical protein
MLILFYNNNDNNNNNNELVLNAGNYRVAAQVVASRAVLSSTELVS